MGWKPVLLSDFFLYPADQLFHLVECNIAHMSDSESRIFKLAVAVSKYGVMFLLYRADYP